MGLASKLAAAQGAGGAPPQGAPYPPGATAYPGAPGGPQGGPPGLYPQGIPQGGPSAPPMPGAPGMPSAPSPYGAGASPPAPYPGGGPPGGMPPYPGMVPGGMQMPLGAPGGGAPRPEAPYPGAPGMGPRPEAAYPGGPPGAYGAPGGPPGAYGAPGMAPPPGAGGQAPGGYPQGPPGAAGGPYGGGMQSAGAPGGMAGVIATKLQQIVTANRLERFYPLHTLPALAARLDARVNFADLAARWRMPKELALDLASLALYDIVLFVDDSGSMAFEENGERIDDLKLISSKVAEVATMFDDDGILMRFMNSTIDGSGLRSQADVANLLSRIQYSGTTPLAGSLQSKVLNPIVYQLANSGQLQKPVLIMTITDGEPTDNPKDMVVQVIKESRHRTSAYGPKAVAFEFAQVGKDQRAQAFLSTLDTHPEVGGSIDCTSYFELEQAEYAKKGVQLSPEAWLVKMMVGAIDPSYDEQDEV